MKKLIPIMAALAISSPAFSQETSAGADAQNNVSVVAITGAQGDTDSTIRHKGGTWSTPTVLGSSFGGANPCLVGTGGGAAAGPLGLSLSIGKSDEGCTRRSDAAAWHALGLDGVAVSRMCQDKDNAEAFFRATKLRCPGDSKERKYADGSLASEAVIPNRVLASADRKEPRE